jgi:broad specificity phosphatase PhoE
VRRLFVIARHAESVANVARDVSSDPSRPVALTDHGREEAGGLAAQLANVEIDVGVCTRFLRTRQTLDIALAGRDVPVVVEAGLDDVDAGDLDGAPMERYWAWKREHGLHERFPGGESLADALRRYAVALRRLAARTEAVTLVVTHEFPLRHIVAAAADSLSAHDVAVANAVPYLLDEPALLRAATGLDAAAGEERPSPAIA